MDFELGDRPVNVDLAGDGPVLVKVEAAKVQPGVCAIAGQESIRSACLDVHPHGAVSVHLDGNDAKARIWAAEHAEDPFDATIEVHRFTRPALASAGSGSRQGSIPAGGALSFELPAQRKRIALALEEGAVAVLAGSRSSASPGPAGAPSSSKATARTWCCSTR